MKTLRSSNGLGWQIGELRHAAGLSQAELGNRAGLSQQHVSQIERDLLQPTISVLCRLADALAADWSYDGRRIIFRRRK